MDVALIRRAAKVYLHCKGSCRRASLVIPYLTLDAPLLQLLCVSHQQSAYMLSMAPFIQRSCFIAVVKTPHYATVACLQ